MKVLDISKYLMIGYTFMTSPLAGIGFLGYVLYTDRQLKNLERQIRAADLEKEGSILTDNLEDVSVKGNISNFECYEDCIIENYQNRFYRIMKPSGQFVPKIFLSLDEAKKEVDIVTPFLVKPKSERSRIYNIRYVK